MDDLPRMVAELDTAQLKLRSTLVATLRKSKTAYDNALDAHERRRAAVDQIVCLLRFGVGFFDGIDQAKGYEDSATLPTEDLLLALLSLDLGRQESILQPRKKIKDDRAQGGRPRSFSLIMLRAYALAASEALKMGGVPPSIADDTIARSLTQLRIQISLLRTEKLAATTIDGWRKGVSKAAADDPMRQLYNRMAIKRSEAMLDLIPGFTSWQWVPPAPHHELRFSITGGILRCWALMDELRLALPRSLTDGFILGSMAPKWVGRVIPKRL